MRQPPHLARVFNFTIMEFPFEQTFEIAGVKVYAMIMKSEKGYGCQYAIEKHNLIRSGEPLLADTFSFDERSIEDLHEHRQLLCTDGKCVYPTIQHVLYFLMYEVMDCCIPIPLDSLDSLMNHPVVDGYSIQ